MSRARTVLTPFIPHAASLGGFGHASGGLLPMDTPGPTDDQVRVDDLVRRSLRWLVLVAISSRVGLTVPAAMLSRGELGDLGDRVVPLAATIALADAQQRYEQVIDRFPV